jgi:hypothetical protein
LEGVKNIQILPGDSGDTQKVTFESTSDKHDKAALDKSLGDQAATYVVKKVDKAAAEAK